MSALRKLRQLKQNADAATAAATPTVAAVKEEVDAKKSQANAFAMLQDDEEEEANEDEPAPPVTPLTVAPVGASASDSADASPSSGPAGPSEAAAESSLLTKSVPPPAKKKPTAKAKATPKKTPTQAKASAAAAAPEREDWELEFAADARPDSAASSATAAAAASSASSSVGSTGLWSVLSTSSRLLDSSQEIRAIFGGRMERGANAAGGAAGGPGDEHAGPNRGGFRKGGAMARRMVGGGIGARATAASKRMLVRPNPSWPRTEEKGLLKMEFIPKMSVPKEPKAAKAAPASGMHGNIHSLQTPAASSNEPIADEQKDSAVSKEYALQLARFQSQQLLALTPGARQYSFVHSRDFERIQLEYLSTVASHDVQALSYFSRVHPFHPEAALTMADIFAAQSEYTTAHEFVQRVLHVFENAFSPEFASVVAAGNARMDGGAETNGPFFTALAKHAQTLGKKGCPRTALEVCKFVLSLSPLVDHTGALYAIDYYALRAKQYRFLVDFSREMDQAVMAAYGVGAHPWASARPAAVAAPAAGTNVQSLNSAASATSAAASSSASAGWTQPVPRAPCTFLPNLMYSRALAAFYLETDPPASADKGKGKSASATPPAAPRASAAMHQGVVAPPSLPAATVGGHSMLDSEADAVAFGAAPDQPESASYLLQQALLMWPSMLKPLLEQAGLESAVARSGGAWERGITALTGLYAGGSFFSSSASAAASSTPYLAKLELIYSERSGALWKADKVISWLLATVEALTQRIADGLYKDATLDKFVQARVRFLLGLPFPAVVKALQKSTYTDVVPHLPPELLMAQNHLQFDAAGERARQRAEQMRDAQMQELDVNQHPLRVFLQSLLPWFVAPDGAERQGDAEGAPQNVDEAVARIQALPPAEREAMLRGLMAQAGEAEQAELEAAMGLGDEEDGDAAADNPYADYQFEDDEEPPEEDEQGAQQRR